MDKNIRLTTFFQVIPVKFYFKQSRHIDPQTCIKKSNRQQLLRKDWSAAKWGLPKGLS